MTTCKTVLIHDEPSTADALDGPHRRVADAIAGMIEDEAGGKVIGLEGGWGSGKSTVVNLVRVHLEHKTNFAVVLFDAWAHEGDPLRRTYLERAIHDLMEKTWVDPATWREKLKRLAGKHRDTTATTVSEPTGLGRALAFAAFCVPFGTALVVDALRSGVTIDPALPFAWQFVVGAPLSLAPFVVAGWHCVQSLWKQGKIDWSIVSRTHTTAVTTTTEQPEPTSIEFEKCFSELMDEALGHGGKDRRIILVIDNLDRVDADSALSIWSTLQTFVQERRHQRDEWFRRVWVLVPYDAVGLRKLWDKGEQSRPVSDSFFNKSFQIRFHVPPPVLSDWRVFLDELLERALPSHTASERHLIYRVYEHSRDRSTPPTLRELKLFVNQVGVYHRQWEHKFPLDHMAYFVLARHKHPKLLEMLRSAELPTPDESRLFGNLTNSVAGLLFNTLPDKAMELLLMEPLRRALFDDGDLKAIANNHPQGFWSVFESAAMTLFANAKAREIARAAAKLRNSQLLEEQRPEVQSVLGQLEGGIGQLAPTSLWDQEIADGISALCHLFKSEALSKRLFDAALSAIKSPPSQPAVPPAELVSSLKTILDTAEALAHEAHLPAGPFYLSVDLPQWKGVCVALGSADLQRHLPRIRPIPDIDLMADAQARIAAGAFSVEDVTALLVSHQCTLIPSWEPVLSALRNRLDGAQGLGAPELQNLLGALWEIRGRGSKEAQQAIHDLATAGHVSSHAYRAARKGRNPEGVAMCVLTYLHIVPAASPPPTVHNSPAGHQAISELLAKRDINAARELIGLCRHFEVFDFFWRVLDAKQPHDPLISLCLAEIAIGDAAHEFYTSTELLQRWQTLRPILAESGDARAFDSLVDKLYDNLSKEVTSRAFDPAHSDIYIELLSRDSAQPQLSEWLKSGIDALSRKGWLQALQGDANTARLAVLLRTKGVALDLSTRFSDALLDHARLAADGQTVSATTIVQWGQVLNCLGDQLHHAFRRQLLDFAMSRGGNIAEPFFALYGREIAEASGLKSSDAVVRLLSPLVREKTRLDCSGCANCSARTPS